MYFLFKVYKNGESKTTPTPTNDKNYSGCSKNHLPYDSIPVGLGYG